MDDDTKKAVALLANSVSVALAAAHANTDGEKLTQGEKHCARMVSKFLLDIYDVLPPELLAKVSIPLLGVLQDIVNKYNLK